MGRKKSAAADDWLPEGWKVEARTGDSGTEGKCYIDPSSEHKFFTKAQVLYYLKNADISHYFIERTEGQNSSQPPALKFVAWKPTTEGLPEGWVKETRTIEKGDKIRKDSFYIDPLSGGIFRSRKEVSEYLATGKRRRASKPREPGSSNLVSEQDSLPLATESDEKMIAADNGAGQQFTGNTDASVVIVNSDSLPEAGKLEQGNKDISSEGSSPAAEVPLENPQPANELEATKPKIKKRKHVKGADMPRRTSKRLAGIEADVSLELVKPARARRAAGKKMIEAEVISAEEDSKELSAGKLKPETLVDALPPGEAAIQEGHPQLEVTECDQKMVEMPAELAPSELWKDDPCIQFAIKTLTGEIPVGDANKMNAMNQGSSSNVAVDTSFQELSSMDIWADPCFEFAVKTLTGDLPVEKCPAVDAMPKQQPSTNSSQTVEHSGLTSGGSSSSHGGNPQQL